MTQTEHQPPRLARLLSGLELLLLLALVALSPLLFQRGFDTFRLPKTVFHLGGAWLLLALWCWRRLLLAGSGLGDGWAASHMRTLFVPLAALLGVWGVSGLLASSAMNAVHDLVLLASFCGYLLVLSDHVRLPRRGLLLAGVAVAVATLSAVIGIAQYQHIDLVAKVAAWFGQEMGLLPKESHFVRYWVTVGLVGQPTLFAGYLGVVLPVAVGLMLRARRWWSRLLWGACAGTILVVVFLTHTRGLILVLPVAFLASAVLVASSSRAHRQRVLLPAAALSVATAVLFGVFVLTQPTFLAKLQSLGNYVNSASFRIFFWKVAASMGLDRPVLGLGPGGFRAHGLSYRAELLAAGTRLPIDEAVPIQAHNEYLQVFAETGLVGVFVLCWLLLAAGVLLMRRVHEAEARGAPPAELLWLACLGAGVLVLVGNALFSFPLHIVPSASAFLLVVALLVNHQPDGAPPCLTAPRTGSLPMQVGAHLCGAVLLLGAGAGVLLMGDIWRANRLAYEAQAALQSGDLATGLPLARQAARLGRWKAEFWWLYGSALYQLEPVRKFYGENENQRVLQRLLSFSGEVQQGSAVRLPKLPDDLPEQRRAFELAASYLPLSDFVYHAARAAYLCGDTEAAIRGFRQVLAVTPRGSEHHAGLEREFLAALLTGAALALAENDAPRAALLLDEAVEAAPHSANALSSRALVSWLYSKQSSRLPADLERALALDSEDFLTNLAFALWSSQHGSREEAVRWWRRVALHQFTGNPQVLPLVLGKLRQTQAQLREPLLALVEAQLCLLQRQPEQAAQALDPYAGQLAGQADYHLFLAQIARSRGDRDRAYQEAQRTVDLTPNHLLGLILLSSHR